MRVLLPISASIIACLSWSILNASAAEHLSEAISADQIAEQVYDVSHGKLLQSSSSTRHKKDIAMVVTRPPEDRRKPGRMPTLNTFETFGKSKPADPEIESLQMAIITSGKVKGTGILYVNYVDKSKGGVMSIWLPALRKIRRMNEPAHDDSWIGTNLTYGELVLRKPEHEIHELLGEATLQDCLPVMKLEKWEFNRYTKKLPGSQCGHQGKKVYRLKSTTKFKNWWYDYHISDIDKQTFALYRTVYYKNGEKIKSVFVDWQSLNQPDPRLVFPRYIYALSHEDGSDTMVYVPVSTIKLNPDLPDEFWSEDTLRNHGKK